MPKLCDKFQRFLKQHVVEKYLPLTSLVWNTKVDNQSSKQNVVDISTLCIQVHQHYLRQMHHQQIFNRQKNKQISTPKSRGLTEFLPKYQQRIIPIQTFEQNTNELTQTTQIHSLQLINQKDIETTYFSIDDVETTYSSYMENENISFIMEDSLVQTIE